MYKCLQNYTATFFIAEYFTCVDCLNTVGMIVVVGMMQGYVAEIMLTLESAVDNLDMNVCLLVKDAFMSTPNLAKDSATIAPPTNTSQSPIIVPPTTSSASVRMIAGCRGNVALSSATSSPFTHIRSMSYNLAALSRKAIVSSPPILENKGMCTHGKLFACCEVKSQFLNHVLICVRKLEDF